MSSNPEYFDIEQGSPEWYEVRRGIPTASNFATILTDGKGAETLLNDLAGEVNSGQLVEGYQNAAMLRGKEMEAEVRDRFARKSLLEVKRVGFVRLEYRPGRFVGCSPDGVFKAMSASSATFDSVLEIKTMKPGLMIGARKSGYNPNKCPTEHMAQVQGALWITGLPRAELIIWYRGVSFDLHFSVSRDDEYILRLAAAVMKFDGKLEQLVKDSKGWR